MHIPVEKLLNKIEEELHEAKKSGTEAAIKGRIQAIKTLCELILDEQTEKKEQVVLNTSTKTFVEDEANGDSLFDF